MMKCRLRFLVSLCIAVVALGAWTRPNEVVTPSQVSLVQDMLRSNGADSVRAATVAPIVVRYAYVHDLDPLLVVGVIGVENAELVPRSRSSAGARGVMQIMPFWTRYYGKQCGTNLSDDAVNICYGTRLLRDALDETGDMRKALLRYNGCRSNTACRNYPTYVFARVGRALIRSRSST